MAKKIPNSLFALTFLLAAAGSAFLLPTVSAFSSGRTSSNSNAIDPFSSFEEKGLDRSIGAGRDFSRLTPDEVMQLIDSFIIQVAEDFAEDATKKCHALRTPIDYNAVKTDLVECLTSTVEIVSSKVIQISTTFTLRQADFEREIKGVQESILLQRALTDQQKRFLTKNFLNPICTTLVPVLSECDKPKYTALTKASECKADAERDGEEYIRKLVGDVCRNDGAWIFDFLDAQPLKCAEEYQKAVKSDNWQQCERYFDDYKVDVNRPGQARRLDSSVDFCNVTGKVGDCMSDIFVTSCKENPKPGQVLLNTFKDTRHFWSAKCGACATAAFWPLLAICLLALVPVPSWAKNLL